MDGLRCIDDYSTNCLDEDHRAYFLTLYNGTTQVILVIPKSQCHMSHVTCHNVTCHNVTCHMSQCHIIISQVIMDLCLAGEYQTEYLKHAGCMKSAQTEYDGCVDTHHLWLNSLIKEREQISTRVQDM